MEGIRLQCFIYYRRYYKEIIIWFIKKEVSIGPWRLFCMEENNYWSIGMGRRKMIWYLKKKCKNFCFDKVEILHMIAGSESKWNMWTHIWDRPEANRVLFKYPTVLFHWLECVITRAVIKEKPRPNWSHICRSHKQDLVMHMRKVTFYYHFHVPNRFMGQALNKC